MAHQEWLRIELMPPLISIIIPCYNYGRFLPDAVNSVLAQSSGDWECIIVDDGSTDDTARIAQDFANSDQRIRYFHQQNLGVSAARNQGIALSRGVYLQFLDADDRIDRSKIEMQARFLDEHLDTDLVYGDVRYFSKKAQLGNIKVNAESRLRFPRISAKGKSLLAALIERNIFVVHAPLTRKRAIADAGGFKAGLCGYEDWDLWLKLAMNGNFFRYLEAEDTAASVRIHAGSAIQDARLMLQGNLEVRRELAQTLLDPDLLRINKFKMAFQYSKLAKAKIGARDFGLALDDACVAIRISHADPRILVSLLVPTRVIELLAILPGRVARRFRKSDKTVDAFL